MKYLLDTSILIWSRNDTSRIKDDISSILEGERNSIYYSPISLWEISIKYGLGKLDLAGHTPEEFEQTLSRIYLHSLPLKNEDLISSYRLPKMHGDPFDRMIVWQCMRENCTLLSADSTLQSYEEYGLKLIVNS